MPQKYGRDSYTSAIPVVWDETCRNCTANYLESAIQLTASSYPTFLYRVRTEDLAKAIRREVHLRLDGMVSKFEVPERRGERVNFFAGIIERQRRAYCALHSESPQDRLRAMMSGANRDALSI